jgi:sugar transferase (PEP-CTERM/EpsH1 system associated)
MSSAGAQEVSAAEGSPATRPRSALIAHVIPTLRVAGLENVVARLTDRLRVGFRHAVVTPAGDGPMRARFPEDVPVIAMAEQHRPDRWNALRMARLFRALRPDIVHSRNWSCVDAIIGARLAGVPIVIHSEHGREASDPEGRNRLRRIGRRMLSPMVSQFVTVSRDLARWLIEDIGVPRGKVLSICNGVDTQRFVPAGRQAARAALGLGPEQVVIGTVGRLDPVKDQVGLLKAFSQLPDDSRTVLLIVGDGPCRQDLEATVDALGLRERVRLLGERNDVPAVLSAMDVFVLCSVGEGISNTILEAMATGLPVVATRVGGNPELVTDGSTGFLVEASSAVALATSLRRYLDDPMLLAQHGGAARDHAEAEFSLERMVGAYERLYRGLLDQRTRR